MKNIICKNYNPEPMNQKELRGVEIFFTIKT